MPTPEELKYFVALRDVIAGKMGEWQWHDGWYDPEDGATGKVVPGQVKFFRDPGDEMHNFIRLPLPIDPENPERGLWGMISNCSAKLHFEQCRLDSGKWSFTWHSLEDGPFCKYGETPTLALLKALAAQEGIEVM